MTLRPIKAEIFPSIGGARIGNCYGRGVGGEGSNILSDLIRAGATKRKRINFQFPITHTHVVLKIVRLAQLDY